MLSESDTATVAYFRDKLNAAQSENFLARTLYSNIYDLKKGLVYLYYLHDFDNEVVFNLSEELKRGCRYFELPSLFGKRID